MVRAQRVIVSGRERWITSDPLGRDDGHVRPARRTWPEPHQAGPGRRGEQRDRSGNVVRKAGGSLLSSLASTAIHHRLPLSWLAWAIPQLNFPTSRSHAARASSFGLQARPYPDPVLRPEA